ncbi:hypothetical protein F5Y10DRAFT_263548 [Nemania abortiva]|nr:hypothetical protein F5Y10DRAFT_263548 [Nemania abortiva]
MPAASITPSATLTADDEPRKGKRHECSPILEQYLGEEPAIAERLLAGKKGHEKDRQSAATKHVNTFEQQFSERK